MKYSLVVEFGSRRIKQFEKVLNEMGLQKTLPKNKYTDYDIMFYLKDENLNFGEYTITKTNYHQRIQNDRNGFISRIPILSFFSEKNVINLNIFNFYPESITILDNYYISFNKYNYWIIKPSKGYGGKDITIVSNKETLKHIKEYNRNLFPLVAQRYIENPLLVNKHKVDFRIYVLWINDIVYLNKLFYAKLASKQYNYDDPTNIYAGLTNLSLHHNLDFLWNNTKFYKEYNKEYPNDKLNISHSKLLEKIKIILNTFFTYIRKNIKMEFWKDKKNHYFNIFGFDFLPDDKGNIYLLEINSQPGFSDNRADSIVYNVIGDMVNIIINKKQNTFIRI